MRVVNQITFEAKDDAEALRLASERLGKDAVILSTRTVKIGGFLGLFQRPALMVSAGILQEDAKEEKARDKDDDVAAKERLVAFQKLLEFKQAAEMRSSPQKEGRADSGSFAVAPVTDVGKTIYTATGFKKDMETLDSAQFSQEGLASSAFKKTTFGMPQQASSGENGEQQQLHDEVRDLSKRLDMILERLGKEETPSPDREVLEAGGDESRMLVGNFVRDELYQKLIEAEVEPCYAENVLKEYRDGFSSEPFEKWLGTKIHSAADLSENILGGRKVMLLGPTGVGKTTTIAKLGAIQALLEHREVLLLTSDTYRIAAVDQLRTYAKILGVPIEVIFEVDNFAQILEDHSSAELILLDTAGRGQKDKKNIESFKILYDVFQPDAVHLVLSANMKYRDMLDVIERMSVVPVTHVIFTKLDETVSYGALFNVLQTMNKPVSYFTTGQNVPNDIEVASGERLAGLLMGEEIRRGSRG